MIPPNRQARRARGLLPEGANTVARLLSGREQDIASLLPPKDFTRAKSLFEPDRRARVSEWEAAGRRLGPVLSTQAPKGDSMGPLVAALSNPEVVEAFDAVALPPRRRGPKPDVLSHKIFVATAGMMGLSHMDDVHTFLKNSPEARLRLARLLFGGEPDRIPSTLSYAQHLKGLEEYGPSICEAALAANVRAFRELRRHLPNVGQHLLLDGTAAPAWCQQRSGAKGTPEDEELRRHTPEAGARAVTRDGFPDFWRGYYIVTLSDVATGLPLVWVSQDASLREADALPRLLTLLFRYWPELRPETIAADAAWAYDEYCELLELYYGIHPVFWLRNALRKPKRLEGGNSRSKIESIDGFGRPICREHRVPMDFEGCEVPPRMDLKPGEPAPEARFRARYRCPGGGGHRASLPMHVEWNRLTYYPHYPEGRPDLFCTRAQLLGRRGWRAEPLHQRLKVGYRVGTRGSDRLRLRQKQTFDCLLSLAFLSMTGLALAQLRGSEIGRWRVAA